MIMRDSPPMVPRLPLPQPALLTLTLYMVIVRRKPNRVETDCVAIPQDFFTVHKFVTLVAHVMFMNQVSFLITLSSKISFVTVQHVNSRLAKQLSLPLNKIRGLEEWYDTKYIIHKYYQSPLPPNIPKNDSNPELCEKMISGQIVRLYPSSIC